MKNLFKPLQNLSFCEIPIGCRPRTSSGPSLMYHFINQKSAQNRQAWGGVTGGPFVGMFFDQGGRETLEIAGFGKKLLIWVAPGRFDEF